MQKTLPLSGFLVAYWPIPNRGLSLTGRVILHKVVSSQVIWIFQRLEYCLWYKLANSPIGFWNRLNPTFTMAVHFFRHSTSTNGTTKAPNTEIWSMSGANCKIIDIFWRLEDAGSRQNKINFSFWISASNLKCFFYNYAKERPEIWNVGLLNNHSQKFHQRTI